MNHDKGSLVLKALGHPVRLRMVEGIAKYGCHVNKMVEKLELPQSTVSQHLASLRAAGIVTYRKDGLRSCYCLTDPRFVKLLKLIRDLP